MMEQYCFSTLLRDPKISVSFFPYVFGIYLYLISLANFFYSSEQARDLSGSLQTCGLRLAPFTSSWRFVSQLLITAGPCRSHHCSLGNTTMQTGHTDASPWLCMELCGTGSVPFCALASHLQMGPRRLSRGKVGADCLGGRQTAFCGGV